MPILVTCPSCNHLYHLADSQAGKLLRCKQCGNPITAPTMTQAAEPAPIAPAAPIPLNYASSQSLSPEARRFRRTAVWCSISAALWIITASIRGLLNAICSSQANGGEFSLRTTPLSAFCNGTFLIGDVLIILSSLLLAASATHIRRGEARGVKRALALTIFQAATFLAGIILLCCILWMPQEFTVLMFFLIALGLIPFMFSLLALSSLIRLHRASLQIDPAPAIPISRATIHAGRACYAVAIAHILLTTILLWVALSQGYDTMTLVGYIILLSIGFSIGLAYLLCGLWIQRNGFGATAYTLALASLESIVVLLRLFSATIEALSRGTPEAIFAAAALVPLLLGLIAIFFFTIRAVRAPQILPN